MQLNTPTSSCSAPISIFSSTVLCIFILQPFKWCQSQPASCHMCVCLLCHFLCASVPCCWRARQTLPIKGAQGGLLWQQLCGVCVRVCCCLLAVQRRQAQFIWSPLLLCPLLLLWESFPLERARYSIVPSNHSSRKSLSLSPFFLFTSLSFSTLSLFPAMKLSSLSCSFITFHVLLCPPNVLFFLYFSLSYSPPPLSPWPHRPFLSVCIHHLFPDGSG